MGIRAAFQAFLIGCLAGGLVSGAGAQEPTGRGPKDPGFADQMRPGNPKDQAILHYWELSQSGELQADELVDLGTMLFYRGFPDDAVQSYRRALEIDSELYEAWFRIGFIKHRQGDVDAARHAYRKCLKRRPGHGWCNFYLGLLEEQTGHPSKALEHYQRAFRHAPELADPSYNPEVLTSELSLAAVLFRNEQDRFTTVAPMTYLQPDQVARVRSKYAPTPTPAAEPMVAPPNDAAEWAPATTSASGIQGSAKAPQPKERRPREAQAVPPGDTAFGIPVPRGQTAPPVPTPTPDR